MIIIPIVVTAEDLGTKRSELSCSWEGGVLPRQGNSRILGLVASVSNVCAPFYNVDISLNGAMFMASHGDPAAPRTPWCYLDERRLCLVDL